MSASDNRGKDLFLNGNLKSGVAACAWCHGFEGEGLAPYFPRIASQVPDYTLNQLKVFAKVDDFGNRFAWVMKAATVNLTDEEAIAVAEYFSTMR
jgi:cytochrome c553